MKVLLPPSLTRLKVSGCYNYACSLQLLGSDLSDLEWAWGARGGDDAIALVAASPRLKRLALWRRMSEASLRELVPHLSRQLTSLQLHASALFLELAVARLPLLTRLRVSANAGTLPAPHALAAFLASCPLLESINLSRSSPREGDNDAAAQRADGTGVSTAGRPIESKAESCAIAKSGEPIVLQRLQLFSVVGCGCDDSLNRLRFPRLLSFVLFAPAAMQASLSRLDALADSQLLVWLKVADLASLDDAGLEPALRLH
jgi:hypothetical protein